MIVRERPSGLRLFLVLRGSVLQRIRLTLLLISCWQRWSP
jgi:putative membrane protein